MPNDQEPNEKEQEIERLLQGLYQSQLWRAAGLCGCCGEPPVDGEHCAKAAAHRRAWAHTERFFRQRADAFGPPCGLYVGKDGQWGTWGYQWGDQPFASWDNIIEECAPDAEGAFKCREGMELTWNGRKLGGVERDEDAPPPHRKPAPGPSPREIADAIDNH